MQNEDRWTDIIADSFTTFPCDPPGRINSIFHPYLGGLSNQFD